MRRRRNSLRASLMCVLALNGLNPSVLAGSALLRSAHSRGQILPLVAVVALAVVLLGVGFFLLQMLLGGSKEVQHAVDAGVLHVSKSSLTAPKVDLRGAEITEFGGVAKHTDGRYIIDLSNINRVWGLALLEALNVQKMRDLGLATPDAVSRARQVHQMATDISTRLAQNLQTDTDPDTPQPLHGAFSRLANAQTVRMIGGGTQIQPAQYANSYTDRGKDSNVRFVPDQQNVGLLGLSTVLAGHPLNNNFIRGYEQVSVPLGSGQPLQFMFVPLEHEKKPHLISLQQFQNDADRSFIQPEINAAVPPNAFRFHGRAFVEKAQGNLDLPAHSVTKDMTPGHTIENPRGFIRIENRPPAAQGLHVIDLSNRQTITGYQSNLGLLPGEAGLVLGRSLFNPVENIWGRSTYAQDTGILMLAACLGSAGLGIHLPCIWCFFIPIGAMICYMMCCLMAVITIFAVNCDTPLYEGFAPFSMRPLYGYLPAVSQRGTGRIHYAGAGGSGGICRVTPENAGEHKIFWDWLEGDYSADWGATALAFLLAPPSICFWMETFHGSGAPTPMFSFTADQFESGMRDRVPQNARLVSLLNRITPSQYTQDGSLQTLLYNRRNDPNVRVMYDLMVQRLREIKPQASIDEIETVLRSPKLIPMGTRAFIYLDDNDRFVLATLPGDSLPTWLTRVLNTQPDGTEHVREFRETAADRDRCYRLVDPNADWGGELNPNIAARYPTRVCSYDRYHFVPSSGYHGLLGVLQLGSLVERKCARQGVVVDSSNWNQPQNCFCFTPLTSRENNPNCGSSL
ncbi:MAG TPA: hypothetical protein V6D08_05555 [Candidatus Obscuribacterales bacterium]